MKYCPHCRKPSVKTSGACPHCGMDLGTAPSSRTSGGSGAYEAMSQPDEPVGGSLQIDASFTPSSQPDEPSHSSPSLTPSPSSPSLTPSPMTPALTPSPMTPALTPSPMTPALTPAPMPPTITQSSATPSVAPTSGSSGLELDTDGYQSPSSSVHPSVVPRPSSVPSVAGIPQIPSFTEEEPIDFDPEDLEEVAQYGALPANIIATVSYALRVRNRTALLKQKAKHLEAGLTHARNELVEELARLGERARVGGYNSKQVTALLAQVEAADRSAESAKDAISSERRRHKNRLKELEAKIEDVARRLDEPRAREGTISSKLAAEEEKRRQVEMRLKRVDIEIRNAEELISKAQKTPADGDNAEDREALVNQVAAAERHLPDQKAERQRLRSENALLEDPITDLRESLAAVRNEVDELKKTRVEAAKAREEEATVHASNMSGVSSQSTEAQTKAQTNLAEIGRFIRFDRNAPGWAQELFPVVDPKAQAYLRLWEDHQKHAQASEAYDKSSVKRGYIVMASGAGLVGVGFIALLAILSSI